MAVRLPAPARKPVKKKKKNTKEIRNRYREVFSDEIAPGYLIGLKLSCMYISLPLGPLYRVFIKYCVFP